VLLDACDGSAQNVSGRHLFAAEASHQRRQPVTATSDDDIHGLLVDHQGLVIFAFARCLSAAQPEARNAELCRQRDTGGTDD
jgi:hypothetical protein